MLKDSVVYDSQICIPCVFQKCLLWSVHPNNLSSSLIFSVFITLTPAKDKENCYTAQDRTLKVEHQHGRFEGATPEALSSPEKFAHWEGKWS